VQAGGAEKDVTFVDADHDIDDQIDAAYRTKYRRYYPACIISHIVSPEAQSATIKLRAVLASRIGAGRIATGGMGGASSSRGIDTPKGWAKPSF
jgi:hypothetical protein